MITDVINFWFDELEPSQWWQKDQEFDRMIQRRFSELHNQAIAGELVSWRDTALGALAEVIILDQFSRNIYRDKPESFVYDSMALTLSQFAIKSGLDTQLTETQRAFLYMPYMHSESKFIHTEAVKLFGSLEVKNNLEFELKHKAIIDEFGRYPHRNKILQRDSTKEEIAFLKQPNSSF